MAAAAKLTSLSGVKRLLAAELAEHGKRGLTHGREEDWQQRPLPQKKIKRSKRELSYPSLAKKKAIRFLLALRREAPSPRLEESSSTAGQKCLGEVSFGQ